MSAQYFNSRGKKPSLNVKGRIKLFSASFKHICKESIARQWQLVKTARSDAQLHSTVPNKWAGWMDPSPLLQASLGSSCTARSSVMIHINDKGTFLPIPRTGQC